MASFKKPYSPFDWQKLRPQPIIGVDEVGRGCLAGPVYAGAVVIDTLSEFKEYTDSKTLSASRRKSLSTHILEHHKVGIGFASVEEIARFNILQAALLAMKRAVLSLQVDTGHLLVDGNQKIPGLDGFSQTTLIKGDLRAEPVAAASIVAKVTRDELMEKMSADFPKYGFEKHKGYSTKAHKQAIAQWGPTKVHRKTFSGVREHLSLTASGPME